VDLCLRGHALDEVCVGPSLEEVRLELMRPGREAEAKKRRKTYEVKDEEDWTIRASPEIIEVSLTVSWDLV
jgi:hypothetical protein